MRISFVIPTWHYFNDPFKLQPYWELYYATILKDQLGDKADINLIDLRGKSKNKNKFDDVVSSIEERDFYLYWVMKTGDANEVYSIVKSLKKKFPNSKHIAGGTHVDMLADECEKIFDTIIVGPGENSFNLALKSNSSKITESYSNVPFAETVYPDRSLLPYTSVFSKEMFKQYGQYNATMVYFSRGCFYNCAYCVYNVPNNLQSKSPKKIEEEISYLKDKFKIEAILLKDEIALNPNKKIFYHQMEAIGKSNILWRGQTTSVGTLDQLKMAKDTGCLELSVGIETVDDKVMKFINKTWQSQKRIAQFIENAKKVGIKIKICLIFGLPGEPKDIVEKTVNFIEKYSPDYVSLSGFCPMPGSPIYNQPEKFGIEHIDKDWDKHAHLLYRFSDSEHVGLPFKYKKETEWGNSFTRDEIVSNIQLVQKWLSKQSMTY
jgi:anaerobic magnesium-protoporphyrin IX monomethyl ester cyclase